MDRVKWSWINLETGMSTGEYQFQFLINIDSVSQPSKHRHSFLTVFLRISQWVRGFTPRNISDFLSTQTLQRNYTFDLIANSHIRNLIKQACSTLLGGHLCVATKNSFTNAGIGQVIRQELCIDIACLKGSVMAKCIQEPWAFFTGEAPAERCADHEESHFDLACPST